MDETYGQGLPEGVSERGRLAWLRDMPRWKQVLFAVAVLSVSVGGMLVLASGPPPPTGAGTGGDLGAQFAPGGTGTPAAGPAAEPTGTGVLRLGSSLLIGFCIGVFVRSAVKMAAVAVGFFLVALFLLERGGFVAVDWTAFDGAWSSFWSGVSDEWGDFQRFVTGRLPSAGLATFGLYAGFKR